MLRKKISILLTAAMLAGAYDRLWFSGEESGGKQYDRREYGSTDWGRKCRGFRGTGRRNRFIRAGALYGKNCSGWFWFGRSLCGNRGGCFGDYKSEV